MAATYKLIDKVILSSTASSVEFATIPNTYTDLRLTISARSSNNVDYAMITFNGSSSNFSQQILNSDAAGSGGQTRTDGALQGIQCLSGDTAGTFASCDIDILNYNSSNYKSSNYIGMTENNGTTARIYAIALLWSNTAAITNVKLTHPNSTFAVGSSFYLYGIKNS